MLKSGRRVHMRLVIFVRKLDSADSRMSFFNEWLKEFAKQVEYIDVITWQESSEEGLPQNTNLTILTGSSFAKVLMLQRVLIKKLAKAQALYCHMNPEYTIVSFPMAFLFRVPIIHWYAHGAINTRRKLMELFARHIVTSSAKGFRKPMFQKKLHIMGQGIDISLFNYKPKQDISEQRIVYVGRISPVKDIESILKALQILEGQHIYFDIYGDPAMKEDAVYLKNLRMMTTALKIDDRVLFKGGVPYRALPKIFQEADILVNMSTTGSMDKTVLEALATGCSVITANDAYAGILNEKGMVKHDDYKSLATKLDAFFKSDAVVKAEESKRLRAYVEKEHSLPGLITKIVTLIKR